jgi:hypothetical protein
VVIGALSLACRRHRLAREARSDDVNGWRVGDLCEVAEVRDAEAGVEHLRSVRVELGDPCQVSVRPDLPDGKL